MNHVRPTTAVALAVLLSAVLRVTPHAAEPDRLEANRAAMRNVDLEPLSEFLGRQHNDADFVPWGSPSGIGRDLDLKDDLARFPEFGAGRRSNGKCQ